MRLVGHGFLLSCTKNLATPGTAVYRTKKNGHPAMGAPLRSVAGENNPAAATEKRRWSDYFETLSTSRKFTNNVWSMLALKIRFTKAAVSSKENCRSVDTYP